MTEDKQYENNKIAWRNIVKELNDKTFPVEVLNSSNTTVQIGSAAIIGVIEAIDSKDILSLNFNDIENGVQKEKYANFCSETNATNYKSSIDNESDEQFIQVFGHNVRVDPHLNDEQKDNLKNLLEQFPDLLSFDDTKVCRIKNYEYKINVKPNANLVHCSPSRVSFEQMQVIDKEIECLSQKVLPDPVSRVGIHV